jgi:hypothetical protein
MNIERKMREARRKEKAAREREKREARRREPERQSGPSRGQATESILQFNLQRK